MLSCAFEGGGGGDVDWDIVIPRQMFHGGPKGLDFFVNRNHGLILISFLHTLYCGKKNDFIRAFHF